MVILPRFCVTCDKGTLHRFFGPVTDFPDILKALDGVDLGELIPVSVACCASCQSWSVDARLYFSPPSKVRDIYDVFLGGDNDEVRPR